MTMRHPKKKDPQLVNMLQGYTPEDEQLEPENDGLVQMIFLFPGVY